MTKLRLPRFSKVLTQLRRRIHRIWIRARFTFLSRTLCRHTPESDRIIPANHATTVGIVMESI